MEFSWDGKIRGVDYEIVEDLLTCEVCITPRPAKEFTKAGIFKRCRACRTEARSAKSDRVALVSRLKDRPCLDCGVQFHPCIMEFDHRDPSVKLFNLSDGFMFTEQMILAEADKCDVVCSNCHRLRTWKRTQD